MFFATMAKRHKAFFLVTTVFYINQKPFLKNNQKFKTIKKINIS